MPGSADLVIRVLADTSDASSKVDALIKSLGGLAGAGAAAAVASGFVDASMKTQDAMAKIQMAYNSANFAPGTQKYTDALNTVVNFSGTLATSFSDVADVMAMASKVTDASGFQLSTDKINELTDASIRLGKASGGTLDAITALQDQAVLSKLFTTTDFTGTGNMVAALSQMHPQDENSLLDAAVSLGQYGAPIGVTLPQALAVGNYLSDTAAAGGTGGASVGRTLQRMNTSADQVLDPEQKYSDLAKHRTANERLDDLHSQLAVAEQRRTQMFGQHGLKTAYRRDPAAVMAADDQIAKLQRDIADQQDNVAHLDDAKKSATRGTVNIASMAGTAGIDLPDFAQEIKDSPMQALLDFTRGVHNLPVEQREGAITAAGIVNTKDLKTISTLSDQPDALARMLGIANNPGSALSSISNISLGTTSSKVADAGDRAFAAAAAAGNGPRQVIDGLAQKVLDNTAALDHLDANLTGNPLAGTIATGVISGISAAVPVAIASLLARGGGGAVAAGGGGAATAVAGTALGVAGTVAGTAGVVAALVLPFVLTEAYKQQTAGMGLESKELLAGLTPMQDAALQSRFKQLGYSSIPDAPGAIRQQMGELHINVPSVQVTVNANNGQVDPQELATQIYDAVIGSIAAAWNAVQGEHPVGGQLGGDFTTGTGPN